ncbi:hypothetical protein SARC_00953 [Sphaeroforma arctica JP610]|uniref:Uncharacterized protein n=1 Tax=Sphaeroforma arctica JP610 TaxID=667725 RepID=A0A0L0GF23_9EUKA|nr:hypothetical protein SARC_00953 [Sphaeroforma arctica JP610]KNC86908.1 hypothetical protein SARC_00953 [Sphaeroforma arctica JP610]|eukprot:XP_014160810.1 hypothetical protein SARC_00953 [Sphaeroforma arctica JP610]
MSSSDSPSRVRVTLLNVDNGQKAAVVLKSDYNAIVAACKNKLRKRAKGKSPLYLWTSSPGITLLSESTIESVVDGKTIYVANFPPQECEGDDETQQGVLSCMSSRKALAAVAQYPRAHGCT